MVLSQFYNIFKLLRVYLINLQLLESPQSNNYLSLNLRELGLEFKAIINIVLHIRDNTINFKELHDKLIYHEKFIKWGET